MKVDFANLGRHTSAIREELDEAIARVIDSSSFILGSEVDQLERELEDFCGASHAITCSSGTDALLLSLMAIGIGSGDEVITTPYTFIATAEVIALLGATPVFVDIDPVTFNLDPNKMERAISPRTKAVIPVGLYGQSPDMDEINELSGEHGLEVIEDGAQSFGAEYRGRKSGDLSPIGCTSFFPAKPLGCFGDGGAVFCREESVAEKIRSLRVHGQSQRYIHEDIGIGGRLDALQAAVLRVKLKHYKKDIEGRQRVATWYGKYLSETEGVVLPKVMHDRSSVWAQYTIRLKSRDHVAKKLKDNGVPTAIHYPKPLHLQPCFKDLGYKEGDFPAAEVVSEEVLSLPMNPCLLEDEVRYVADQLKEL